MQAMNLRPAAPSRWTRRAIATLLCLWLPLSGCTVRPPLGAQEVEVDSVTLEPQHTGGVGGSPFCLHLRQAHTFLVGYSANRIEAWVSDGSCASKGARRVVDAVRLHWRTEWPEANNARQCMAADGCSVSAHDIVIGQFVQCATATARQGNQTAFISNDTIRCP